LNEIINAAELGEPKGFSHAVAAGETIYLAGQIGAGETLTEQFDGALGALCTALRAAGGEPRDVVSLQLFVTDVPAYRESRKELGRAWRAHFGAHYPAMGLFGVTELAEPQALVEVMGVAVIQRG
jgi:enamine deaminase RidA (YjgF/YER057c/UK114 family)